MKYLILLILLITLTSCRTLLKNRSSADSTVTRSGSESERFTREIIREYLPGRTDTLIKHEFSTIEVPKVITVDRPVLLRERILETGERQQQSSEEKQVATNEKVVEKQPLPWWVYVSIGVGGMLVFLVIGAIIYLVVKVRSLPVSIINNK